jgi:hypothetical protein
VIPFHHGPHDPTKPRAVTHLGEQNSTAPPWEPSASHCFTSPRASASLLRPSAYSGRRPTGREFLAFGIRPRWPNGFPAAATQDHTPPAPHGAGAGSGLGASLYAFGTAPPRPRPRATRCPGMIRVSRSGPAKGRCTGPSLDPPPLTHTARPGLGIRLCPQVRTHDPPRTPKTL